MSVIVLKPGWTKERMLATIKDKNNNTLCGDTRKCYYRSQGNACAIGAFLPDELATSIDNKYQSGKSVDELINTGMFGDEVKECMPTDDVYFLMDLQVCHDRSRTGSVYSDIESFLNQHTFVMSDI